MGLFNLDYSTLSKLNEHSSTSTTDKIDVNAIYESASSNTININSMITNESDSDYDYMAECYAFLTGYNKAYFDASKALYKNILESCDAPEVINEGFGDFFSKIKEIIKKFLAWIKKIFNKFITKLNGMFKSESHLKKNKNEFSKFDDTKDEFEFEGYRFTNLYDGGNVPEGSAISMLEINDDMKNVFELQGSTNDKVSYDKIKSAQNKWEDGKDDFYDSFRGAVLGDKTDYIPQTQFEEECFMKFRDDRKDKEKITINSSEVNEAYRRFENYSDLKKSVEKTKNDIDRSYSALERYFEKCYKLSKDTFTITDYSGSNTYASGVVHGADNLGMTDGNNISDHKYDDMIQANANTKLTSSDKKALIESFFRARAAQVNQMSNIHSIAFTAKLTAAKDCFNQDKAILYKALAKIKGHKATA